MHTTTKLIALLLLPYLTLTTTGAMASDNLVENPQFDSGDPSTFVESYDASWIFFSIAGAPTATLDDEVAQAGNQSFRFDLGQSGRAILHSRLFQVEPGASYQLSGWVKAENAAADSIFIRIFWFKSEIGDPAEPLVASTEKQGGTFDWTQLQTTVEAPADAGLAYVRLDPNSGNLEDGGDQLFFESEEPVQVWFDSISVTPID